MTTLSTIAYEMIIEAFLKREEYTIGSDTSYPFGGVSYGKQHFALGYADVDVYPQAAPLIRYAWHEGQSVMMQGFANKIIDRIVFDRLNYLSGKLGMEHDAFRLRRGKLYAGIANPMPLKRDQPIEWRPGMTSIDQLLAYRMMVQG